MVESYNGSLTREQFLFYEIRIVSKFYLQGKTVKEATEAIREDNLFQYPTERMIGKMTQVCYCRLDALGVRALVEKIATAPLDVAKQINLYAMMRYNRLVWDFMIKLVGEKFRTQDFSLSRRDLNTFFTRLQEQNDHVAAWSEGTVTKIKQVLMRSLVEAGFMENVKSTTLDPVFLCEELEAGIRANGDLEALPAFNCFRQEAE